MDGANRSSTVRALPVHRCINAFVDGSASDLIVTDKFNEDRQLTRRYAARCATVLAIQNYVHQLGSRSLTSKADRCELCEISTAFDLSGDLGGLTPTS